MSHDQSRRLAFNVVYGGKQPEGTINVPIPVNPEVIEWVKDRFDVQTLEAEVLVTLCLQEQILKRLANYEIGIGLDGKLKADHDALIHHLNGKPHGFRRLFDGKLLRPSGREE
jgi:hypothetical protein